MNTVSGHTSRSEAYSGIYDLTPFTLLDYPDHTACIIWMAGCNLRCHYCYNPHIVLGKGKFSHENLIDFLESRKGLLEGVVFSGGECTLHPSLLAYCRMVKEMGFKIKIDTNGTRPEVIRQLINQKLVDYVAMDFKAGEAVYKKVTNRPKHLLSAFWRSLRLLQKHRIPYECRTTFHSELMNDHDLIEMAEALYFNGYRKPFFIQHFRGCGHTLSPIGKSDRPKTPEKSPSGLVLVHR